MRPFNIFREPPSLPKPSSSPDFFFARVFPKGAFFSQCSQEALPGTVPVSSLLFLPGSLAAPGSGFLVLILGLRHLTVEFLEMCIVQGVFSPYVCLKDPPLSAGSGLIQCLELPQFPKTPPSSFFAWRLPPSPSLPVPPSPNPGFLCWRASLRQTLQWPPEGFPDWIFFSTDRR